MRIIKTDRELPPHPEHLAMLTDEIEGEDDPIVDAVKNSLKEDDLVAVIKNGNTYFYRHKDIIEVAKKLLELALLKYEKE